MREVAGTQASGEAAVSQVPGLGQSALLRHQLELLLHFFEKQSRYDRHQSPVSTHIFAGWPSAQKSLSVDE
jgi:hypothetical protein